jgi:hypothetical protein
MTEDQFTALEEWIEAIIAERDRASDIHDSVRRMDARKEFRRELGLPVYRDDD